MSGGYSALEVGSLLRERRKLSKDWPVKSVMMSASLT